MDRIFPLEEVRPPQVVQETPDEEIEARLLQIQNAVTYVAPRPDAEKVHRLGDLHQMFEQSSELWGSAKRVYEVVAEMSGLPLEDLVKMVYKLERMMFNWERAKR